MSIVQQALPILLTTLGGKMGVKIEVWGNEAFTDGETIRIPALPIEGSPSLRTRAYGYGGHEASHVRNTDMNAFKDFAKKGPFAAHILNIIEDIRIERALIAEFPGMAKVLSDLVADIVTNKPKSFAPPTTEDPPEAVLAAWLLITRRHRVLKQNALAKADMEAEAVFQGMFPASFRLQLENLLTGLPYIGGGKSATMEAIKMAQAILDLIKSEAQKPTNPRQQPRQSGSHSEGSSRENDSQSAEVSQDGDGQGQSSSCDDAGVNTGHQEHDLEGQSGNTSDPSELEQSAGCSGASGSPQDPNGSALRELASKGAHANGVPEDLATDLSDAIRDELVMDAKEAPSRLRIETLDWKEFGDGDGLNDPARAKKLSGPLRQRLRLLVEDQRRVRPRAVRSGKLLMTNRLARVAMGDSRVFRTLEEARATNAALHLLVDCSGSMQPFAREVGTAALALAEALDTIKAVNLAITGFGSWAISMLRHGERLNAVNRNRICGYSFKFGGTPLAEALVTVSGVLLNQSEDRKILIVLTDGIPDGGPEPSANIIKRLRAQGVIVLGIGLVEADAIIEMMMESMFGSDYEMISSADEIREAIFRLTQRAITR